MELAFFIEGEEKGSMFKLKDADPELNNEESYVFSNKVMGDMRLSFNVPGYALKIEILNHNRVMFLSN